MPQRLEKENILLENEWKLMNFDETLHIFGKQGPCGMWKSKILLEYEWKLLNFDGLSLFKNKKKERDLEGRKMQTFPRKWMKTGNWWILMNCHIFCRRMIETQVFLWIITSKYCPKGKKNANVSSKMIENRWILIDRDIFFYKMALEACKRAKYCRPMNEYILIDRHIFFKKMAAAGCKIAIYCGKMNENSWHNSLGKLTKTH